MDRFQPQKWLRIFGLAVSLVIGVRHLTSLYYASGSRALSPTVFATDFCAFAGFVAAFLYTTRSVIEPRKVSPLSLLVLVIQLPLALSIGSELAIIATTAVPFLLAGSAAFAWLFAEITLFWVISIPGATPENIELSSGLANVPFPIAFAFTMVEVTAWLLFAFCIGFLIVRAERNRRELLQRNAELEATQALLSQSSAMNERLRISRELHDSVGHHLAGLSVNLELASHLVTGPALSPVQRALLIARLLLADVRDVVTSMREDRRLEVSAALQRMAGTAADLRVHLDIDSRIDEATPAVAHFVFRCAQEVLTNTRKHAGARNVWITIRPDGDGLHFHAEDDGRGALFTRPGNGLRGMRERAEAIGATLSIRTARGRGFRIDVSVPSVSWEPAT